MTDTPASQSLSNPPLFISPDLVVQNFRLEKGDLVAEFGCGKGYFSIPIARAVGPEGKIYCFDIQKDMLDAIRARAKMAHLLTIELVWADLEQPKGSKLKDESVDFVLIAGVLFQVQHKETLIREAARILRSKGRMALIEWDDSPSPLGPPRHLRITKDAATRIISNENFVLQREFEAGSHHYGLMFVKQ